MIAPRFIYHGAICSIGHAVNVRRKVALPVDPLFRLAGFVKSGDSLERVNGNADLTNLLGRVRKGYSEK